MKPRALKTYKILAVALTAAAGCAKAGGPDPATDPAAEPIRQEVPAARTGDPAAAIPAPPPDQPMSTDPTLLALRDELATGGREPARAQRAHFRPLCDKDGYPLVGNVVMGKSASARTSDAYQPSAFCGEIRQQAQK